MFGFRRSVTTLTPADIHARMQREAVVLVDVREAAEFATGHIEGAVLAPLSSFDPAALPAGTLVLYCAIGRRSVTAAEACTAAGIAIAGHMGGGLKAWAQAGLPVVT